MHFGYPKTRFFWKDALFGWGGIIVFLVVILLGIGIIAIHSASYRIQDDSYRPYAVKQIIWACITLIPFLVILYTDYMWLIKHAFKLYWFSILLLILTLICGTYRGGAKRWIKIGPLLLQTSEIIKLVIILVIAKILISKPHSSTFDRLFSSFLAILLPMGLIIIQPDLGTSLILIPIAFCMTFVSGIRIKPLIILLLILMNLGILVYFYGLHEYQRKRVLMFINQDNMSQEDKRGAGYHLHQSKITLGNGGLWGKGWQKGTQNRYGFLPERHTDFIFAVIAEEFGFLGTSLVLTIYFVLFLVLLAAAYTALTSVGQFMIIGVTTLLSCQTVVNTCMTMGLAPITGLPLPFISYGGSSLLFNFASIAMVVSVVGRKVEYY